jgi:hypothetical protein
MKTPFLLLIAFFFAFIGCSGDDEGSGGGNSDVNVPNPDVNVPTAGKTVDVLLDDAINSLKEEKWDDAVAYYNAAYDKDNNDTRTIIYSVLANLAKISTDPKVVALMKEHFGFVTYPDRLNALFSDDWLIDYRDEEWCYYSGECKYYSDKLPAIRTPDWIKNSELYADAMFGNVLSTTNWGLSLFANILDKNATGFNSLLDDVIDGVFGASYNAAAERLKKLENKKETRIRLDPYFIRELELEDVFDEYDKVGWAEVNVILSSMLLSKASLEWVQSYDLSSDLNWLRYSWKDDRDDVLERFRQASKNSFPFNNNFLKARPGKMANAKADYIKAIEGLQASYASIINSELYPDKVKESYNTINDGFGKLIAAIKNDGKFYIPEEPTKGNWPTTKRNDVEVTIDMGKLFTAGYFSLQNIFEVENGKPVFYSDGMKLTPTNFSLLMSINDGNLQLNLNVGRIEAIIDESESRFELIGLNFDKDFAKAIFDKYY